MKKTGVNKCPPTRKQEQRPMPAWTLLTCSLMILLLDLDVAPVRAQEISPQARAALQYFIDIDCALANEGAALIELLSYGNSVEGILIRYLREGPDASSIAALQNDLSQRWTSLEEFLRSPSAAGDAAVLDQKRQLFFTLHRQSFIQKYRERSAIALAAIGSPEAIRQLNDQGATTNEGLRKVIAAAMQKFQR